MSRPVLYGEGTDEHACLGRAPQAAAIARFAPVPTAPPRADARIGGCAGASTEPPSPSAV